jgi:hypothetical protein
MGGRLDATNIIPDDAVLVSALTAVDLDHQYYLGDTVGKIALEKAGIARKNRPFVLGSQNLAHAEQVVASVKKVIDEVGAVLVPAITVLKRDWDAAVDGPVVLPSCFFIPITSSPTCRNLPPLFLLPASSPPSSLWRTPTRQPWHRTYRDQRPPDRFFMRRKVISRF